MTRAGSIPKNKKDAALTPRLAGIGWCRLDFLPRATRPPTLAALVAGKPKIKVESCDLFAHVRVIIARRRTMVKRKKRL
jgi:hypothetical protein